MILHTLFTYLHLIGIIGLLASIVIIWNNLKEQMGSKEIKTLQTSDIVFGVFAAITLITGLIRMYYFGKGATYYSSNPLFITKLFLFIIVGLLSIYPSVQFRKLKTSINEIIKINHYKRIKAILLIEIIILIILPLFASMVRYGIFQ